MNWNRVSAGVTLIGVGIGFASQVIRDYPWLGWALIIFGTGIALSQPALLERLKVERLKVAPPKKDIAIDAGTQAKQQDIPWKLAAWLILLAIALPIGYEYFEAEFLPLQPYIVLDHSQSGAVHTAVVMSRHEAKNIFAKPPLEAMKIVNSYAGRWMRLQFTASDLERPGNGTISITTRKWPDFIPPFQVDSAFATMSMNQNDTISVFCRIAGYRPHGFDLQNCEVTVLPAKSKIAGSSTD